jgi:hypothetical protein
MYEFEKFTWERDVYVGNQNRNSVEVIPNKSVDAHAPYAAVSEEKPLIKLRNMILQKHQAMPFTCNIQSIISINTPDRTKILDQIITYSIFSYRQCIIFHPSLPSAAKLSNAGYHSFDFLGFTQLIVSTICKRIFSLTDSLADILHSHPDNFPAF